MKDPKIKRGVSHGWVWWLVAVFGGFMSAGIFYDADVFWQDTGFVFGLCAVLAVWTFFHMRVGRLHDVYLLNNPGIGLVRVSFRVALFWIVFVLIFFSDDTIVHIWYVFYFLMGYAAVGWLSILACKRFGIHLRRHVYERKNFAAAIFVSAFMFATGLIYGGSIWGSATPESLEYGGYFEFLPGYEDAWWVTPWFFIMGWLILVLVVFLWMQSEGDALRRIRSDRDIPTARAAAIFCISCAIPLTDAVAGDYYGIRDSLLGFGVIALPVLVHEIVKPRGGRARRAAELWIYPIVGIGLLFLTPLLSTLLGFRI